MVFLKVIPASLLFIHGSAGHCNLETCMCMCVRGRASAYVHVRVCAPNSIREQEVEQDAREKSGEKGKKRGEEEGGQGGDVVGNMGLDFRP